MPICKIYHTNDLIFNIDEIEKIIVDGFDVKGTRPEILVLPATEIKYGRNVYIEIICKDKVNRSKEKIMQIVNELEQYIKTKMNINAPFKIRVLQVAEDKFLGIN